jgi:hypothetical protein
VAAFEAGDLGALVTRAMKDAVARAGELARALDT